MSFTKDIYAYIKKGETSDENLGLEIEHFVVNEQGTQIDFDTISTLVEQIGERENAKIIYTDGHPVGYIDDEYCITLEPSCQFEISINPYSDIEKIERVYKRFLSIWEPEFKKNGYHIVTKGNLPIVEKGKILPEEIPLSPKKRYKYMSEYLSKSGKYGAYMMRASASTQVSVDYKSENDLIRKIRLLEQISPILMIMMESKNCEKSTLPENPHKKHLLRTQEWDDLDPARTGFYPFSFDKDFGYKKISDVIYNTPLILFSDNGNTIGVGDKSAADLIKDKTISVSEVNDKTKESYIEHFISMGFFHVRIKKYLEVRVADSVPIKKALGYVALLKGILYSKKNILKLEDELKDIDDLSKIQSAVENIEIFGKESVIYHKKTAGEWISHLKDLASDSLEASESAYLNYL